MTYASVYLVRYQLLTLIIHRTKSTELVYKIVGFRPCVFGNVSSTDSNPECKIQMEMFYFLRYLILVSTHPGADGEHDQLAGEEQEETFLALPVL